MQFFNNLDLHQNEIQNFRVQNLAAAPANPVAGQHYFNTVDNTEYVYNGTAWVNALSQGDFKFEAGLTENDRTVTLDKATKAAIGGVVIGDNIDVADGKISVKDASAADKGLIQLATDEEAAAGLNEVKAINAKQLKVVADAVETEAGRADAAEKANAVKIAANEKAIAKNAEDIAANTTAINGEIERAKAEEAKKVDKVEGKDLISLTDIAQIATNKEGVAANKTAIEGLDDRLTTAETGVADNKKAIETEATTARAAEKQNADDIDALEGRMTTAEGTIADNTKAINTEKERAERAEKANADAIAADVADLAAFKTTVADTYIDKAQKGAANGVATLDANGLVPAAQLPSYVDDVVDLVTIADAAPATCAKGDKYYNATDKKVYVATAENTWGEGAAPEADKIYVTIDTNMCHRWSGTTMVQIGADKLKGFNGTIAGDDTTTTFTLNHNLGTRNVVCEVYEAATYEKVYVNIVHTSTTAVQAIFSQAPKTGENFIMTIIAIG